MNFPRLILFRRFRSSSCTPIAASFSTSWAYLRRAEWGQHHHISGRYLGFYAGEAAWREDFRRKANGELYGLLIAAAAAHPVSRQWKGYWQRAR